MNYKEFISEYSSQIGKTQKDADMIVSAITNALREAFSDSNSVSFQGFGIFELKRKEERIVKNPQTQQRMLIPPKQVVEFKPSITLKEQLKELPPSE